MKKKKKQASASQEYTERAKRIESYWRGIGYSDREINASWIGRPAKPHEKQDASRMEAMQHYIDTSEGLWCIDRNPSEVSKEWINENAFRLKFNDNSKTYAGCDSSREITLTEADRELIQKMIDKEIMQLREEEKRKQEFLKIMEDVKSGKHRGWF